MRETTRGARAGRSVRGAVVGAVATIILGWGSPAAATTFNVNTTGDEARHPLLGEFFDEFRDGRYVRRRALN